MRLSSSLLFLSFAAATAAQQSETKPPLPAFEAASVVPFVTLPGALAHAKMSGGPGSSDPGRIEYQGVTLGVLVQQAYNLAFYRLSAPPWINSQRYSVTATIPSGTSDVQFRQMLQRFLAERFRLVARMEEREIPVYRLSVGGAGAKLKPWSPDDDRKLVEGGSEKLSADADGYPILPRNTPFLILNGHARLRGVKEKLSNLAEFLSGVADRPVVDNTGLDGEYGFTLSWMVRIPGAQSTAEPEPGTDLFAAVESQLGLKLSPAKAAVQVLVLENVERTPAAN